MGKILSRKFRKPKAYVPPNPASRPSRAQALLGKRRRPLQPGELERIHHGNAVDPAARGGGLFSQQQTTANGPFSVPLSNSRQYVHDQPGTSTSTRTEIACSFQNGTTGVPPNAGQSLPVYESQRSGSDVDRPFPTNPVPQAREEGRSSADLADNSVPVRTFARPQNAFASNEFDADNFYGFDDEEENEETNSSFLTENGDSGGVAHDHMANTRQTYDNSILEKYPEMANRGEMAAGPDNTTGNQILAPSGGGEHTNPPGGRPGHNEFHTSEAGTDRVKFVLPLASSDSSCSEGNSDEE